MLDRKKSMRISVVAIFIILLFLYPFYAVGSDFEDDSTPIEQEDQNTIDQTNEGNSSEYRSTPIEQSDVKTIDQVDEGRSDEDEATPVEKEDTRTIDQINE